MYYSKHEQECFISMLWSTRSQGFSDADKARIASILNGFKNDQSYELIGEEILKVNDVESEKIKVKVYANQEKCLSQYKDTD